jgi:hypothetical protein
MNSDEDKIYMKIVAFNKIYNFVVQNFFISSHLVAQKMKYHSDLNFRYPDVGTISLFPASRWLQMEKFELQNYRSRRKVQFSYKLYIHPIS